MKRISSIGFLIALAFLPLMSGCVSSSKVTTSPTESVGRQLLDLEQAYKNNVINEEQYEKLKKKLIDKYD